MFEEPLGPRINFIGSTLDQILHRPRFLSVLCMLLVLASNAFGCVNLACCCQRAAVIGGGCSHKSDSERQAVNPSGCSACCQSTGRLDTDGLEPECCSQDAGECCAGEEATSSDTGDGKLCQRCSQCGKQALRAKAAVNLVPRHVGVTPAYVSRTRVDVVSVSALVSRDLVGWSSHNHHRAQLGVWIN